MRGDGRLAAEGATGFQLFGDEEGELERLLGVEAGVAEGLVSGGEVGFGQAVGAAGAFGDVLAGHLDVDAAGPGALGGVGVEEAADFGEDGVEAAGFDLGRGADGVAVHRVADPGSACAFLAYGSEQRGELAGDVLRAHAADEGEAAGLVAGIEGCDQAQQGVRIGGGADLEADRVFHAAEELDVRAVELAGAVADPEEVGGAGVVVARGAVDAGERLLVGQEEGFVAGVEVGLADLLGGGAAHAAGGHEGERFVDARREVLIAGGERGAGGEVEVPAVDLVEVGVAAGGEGAQQVEGSGGLEVGGFHAGRVRGAGLGGEIGAIDDVAAVAGEGDVIRGFRVAGAGLGVLPGHAAHFDDGHAGAEGQHDGHLQQDAEGVADDVGLEVLEALGAVAALEDEGLAVGCLGQGLLEAAGFAGKDQGGIGGEAGFSSGQGGGVWVGGKLARVSVAPGGWGPGRLGESHFGLRGGSAGFVQAVFIARMRLGCYL